MVGASAGAGCPTGGQRVAAPPSPGGPDALKLNLRREKPTAAFAPLDAAGVLGPIENEIPSVIAASAAGKRAIFFRPDLKRLRLAIASNGERPASE